MTQEQEVKQSTRIFLSYSSEDAWYVRNLSNRLAKRTDVTVFETQSLSAGEDWTHRLKEEIVHCTIFLVVLSPRSVKSPWVLHELGAAWGLDKRIIAVITDPEVGMKLPAELGRLQLVEAGELQEPGAIARLIEDDGVV